MIDPTPLWDFEDPSGSEDRFRKAADLAKGRDQLVLLTQVARALGLQERYDDGHAVLDNLSDTDPEVASRIALERGRLLRSAGSTDQAGPHFEDAEQRAAAAGLDALRIDALHMSALVADPTEQLALNEQALSIARASADPRARDWDASLLNNIGMSHADADDFTAALASFERALTARERIGEVARTRVAKWMVAWALRNLGRPDEALARQLELRAELAADGLTDPYVDDEIALLEDDEQM